MRRFKYGTGLAVLMATLVTGSAFGQGFSIGDLLGVDIPPVLESLVLRYGVASLVKPTLTDEELMAKFSKFYNVDLVAKAQPDEYYCGRDEAPHDPQVPCDPTNAWYTADYNKVNQAYVWGMTKRGPYVWFGTGANVNCLVGGTYHGGTGPGNPTPGQSAGTCEYGLSWVSSTNFPGGPMLDESIGDWRPPHIYRYNTLTKALTMMDNTLTTTEDKGRLATTLGVRSAGSNSKVIILGGPSIDPGSQGINLFAFDAFTGRFLGSRSLTAYGNVRKWLYHDGELYTAVAAAGDGEFSYGGGSVLRWIDNEGHPDYPLAFEVVGDMDSGGAEVEFHEGRLFVTTWPSLPEGASITDPDFDWTQVAEGGLYMSPVIPEGGLTSAHAAQWEKVWTASDYEPDPFVAKTYGGGGIASYKGKLFWGTMHVELMAAALFFNLYESDGTLVYFANGGLSTNPVDKAAAYQAVQAWQTDSLVGTHRAFSVLRGEDFGTPNEDIKVMYGLDEYPVYRDAGTGNAHWEVQKNNFGPIAGFPRMGLAGMNNYKATYCWVLEVYDNRMFLGGLDTGLDEFDMEENQSNLWSMVEGVVLGEGAGGGISDPFEILDFLDDPGGGDLFCFVSPYLPALPVSRAGLGNRANYGYRTMVTDATGMYIGTANPRNLWTDLTDDKPEGGWELIEVKKKWLFAPKEVDLEGPTGDSPRGGNGPKTK